MSAESAFDVAIAGGGIVGCACALACAQRGLRVTLAERDVLGSGATAAGMGHIVVMEDSEAQFALTRTSQHLWRKLDLPAECEYVETGTLWVAADREEMEGAERKHAAYRQRDVPCRLLTSRELSDAEPNLAPSLAGGLLIPEDAVVYPSAVALELARRAQQLGTQIIVGHAVKSFGHGLMLLDDGTEICAQRLVLALGAEATAVMPLLPVRKRKGHLVITDRYPGFVSRQLVELGYLKSAHGTETESVAFNVQPRKTGQLLIGSSRQFGDESTKVNQHMLSAMLARAAIYLPGISRLNAIRVWTGFRAATPDKLPLIGPSTEDDTVWLATGHEGLGITTSLATAELIAAALTGDKPPTAPEPYLPGRFGKPAPNSIAGKERLCTGMA
ncbi:MAG TPA: FAD-dependent oxidoreductase [Terracidiphilus sp.]|nr:FAD-dependent oxidoreductase [Terracidiphilus sp.]